MRVPLLLCTALFLPACLAGEATTSEEVGAIEVTIEPPPEVSCVAFHLVDQDDQEVVRRVPVTSAIALHDVGVGAYRVSARAYSAASCEREPARVPWATVRPVTVIVTRGSAQLALALYRVGTVTGTATFVETPEVIAVDQPDIGTLAADENWVAWVRGASDDTAGSVHALADNRAGTGPLHEVATGVQRPSDLTIHPRGFVFWLRARTSATASDGGIGAWDWNAPRATVATGQTPGEIIARGDRVYWTTAGGELRAASAWPDFAAQAPITGQAQTNALAADDEYVYWSTDGDRAIHRARHGSTEPVDVVAGGVLAELPIGLAVDATHVYWSDWRQADRTSAIWRARKDGSGGVEQIFPVGGERFRGIWPVEVDGGHVYFVASGGVWRVPVTGGPGELIQDGAISGLALSQWDGHHWLYWGDRELGGVVWRQRLD